jgi:hypothetical protein
MIKKRLLFLSLLLNGLSLISFGQNKDCLKSMRTGKFTYAGRNGEGIEILRSKGEQVELTNNGRSKLILSIDWRAEDIYVLTLKKIVNNQGCLNPGDWIRVKIIACEGTSYKAKFDSERCGSGESVFVKLE